MRGSEYSNRLAGLVHRWVKISSDIQPSKTAIVRCHMGNVGYGDSLLSEGNCTSSVDSGSIV